MSPHPSSPIQPFGRLKPSITLNMDEQRGNLRDEYLAIIPILEDTPKSLHHFVLKADALYITLPNADAVDIFLEVIKESTSTNTHADIALLNTWEDIKNEFKHLFLPWKSVSQLHLELTSMTPNFYESYEEFAVRVRRASDSLKNAHRLAETTVEESEWKNLFQVIETQATMGTFIQAYESAIKRYFIKINPETMKDAEYFARDLDYLAENW